MLPLLGRRRGGSSEQLPHRDRRSDARTLVAPLFVALQFIRIPGVSNCSARPGGLTRLALLPMGVDSIFALISAVASSGHRVAFAATRSLPTQARGRRPSTGCRPVLRLHLGVAGAAWSMAVISMVNAIIWWIQLRRPCPSDVHDRKE